MTCKKLFTTGFTSGTADPMELFSKHGIIFVMETNSKILKHFSRSFTRSDVGKFFRHVVLLFAGPSACLGSLGLTLYSKDQPS